MKRALLTMLLCAAACSAPEVGTVPRPSGSPPATSDPTPTAEAAPSASHIVEPSASPPPESGSVLPIRASALGRLTGNWMFVGKQVPDPKSYDVDVQIWAIPLDTGAPRLAVSYDVSIAGVPEAIFDNAPRLRRQFSPDGTRLVVSVSGALVVVELITGQIRPLGVSGYFPAWSKDGSQIAFVSYLPVDQVVPPEQAIFVVPAAGGPVREIARVGYGGRSVEWSPDGSTVIVASENGTTFVDAATGRVVRHLADRASFGSFASWRAATPQIAIASGVCDQTPAKLIGLDDASASTRTLLDTGESCPDLILQDPRWNPASLDELLYVATRAKEGAMPHEYRAHLLNVRSGRDTTLPLDAYEATWTRDGGAIAYLAKSATGFFADSVRIWRRDGGGERVLLNATGNESFFTIVSLGY